jgi:hypothetical protein
MKRTKNLMAKITLWVSRFVAAVLVVLLFTLPAILDWYTGFRFLSDAEQRVITIAFYCCVVVIGFALWNVDSLLRAILSERVFVRENVRSIRRIQWCCGLVAVITGVTCFAYLPLVFLAVIMAFLCLMISVGASVMDAAVTLQEENALTI